RTHRCRAEDAAVVMVTFNDRCQRTRNTYAVTSHQYGYTAAVLIQYIEIHGFGIFCAELEYLSDFDPFHEFYITASILSLLTFCDEAEITRARNFKVTSVVDVDVMISVIVRSGRIVVHHIHLMIEIDGDGCSHRTQAAGRSFHNIPYL